MSVRMSVCPSGLGRNVISRPLFKKEVSFLELCYLWMWSYLFFSSEATLYILTYIYTIPILLYITRSTPFSYFPCTSVKFSHKLTEYLLQKKESNKNKYFKNVKTMIRKVKQHFVSAARNGC